MSVNKDFVDRIKESAEARAEEQGVRPTIEVWPVDDDFGRWVASHEHPERRVTCASPEFKDTPHCGAGHH